jgi:metal-sulfur cluster biosynthetic enzyme
VVLASRPSVTSRIEFIAKRRVNPIDIYFMIDLTKSMETVKNRLATIVTNIKNEIVQTTSDYRFGFGGFNEKPIPPFDSFHTEANARQFDFKHIQSMTRDTQQIIEKINGTELFPGNKDSPEGGLDGLMQLLLCNPQSNEIGWRDNVKGIVVFVTNAPSHLAGDGLLGGLWKPYEHRCNMEPVEDGSKIYNSLDTDYPSVSSLRFELKRSQKSVIFGTGAQVLDFYRRLSKALGETLANADDMQEDGGRLQEVILDVYNKLASRVTVKATNGPEIEVSIEEGGVFEDVNVDNEDRRWVEVKIKPEVCDRTENGKISFELKIENQEDIDTMKVEIEAHCSCNCDNLAPDSSVCTEKDSEATLNCGACNCVAKRGEKCLCDEEDSLEDSEACADENGVICTNNGHCECGKCKCNDNYVGDQCECHDLKNLCAARGSPQCEEGQVTCRCNTGWTNVDGKKDCSCSTNPEHPECLDPKSKKTCSGKGTCKCAKCECNSDSEGVFCQKEKGLSLSDIKENTCNTLTPCILDHHIDLKNATAEKKEEWRKECSELKALDLYTISIIEAVQEQNDTENSNRDGCSTGQGRCEINLNDEGVVLSDSCSLTFCHNVPLQGMNDYEDSRSKQIDLGIGEQTCGLALPMTILIGSSVGAGALLFIIGFLTFCIVINCRDRREYKKFRKLVSEVDEKGAFKDNRAYRQSRVSLRKSMMPNNGVTFGGGKD